MRVVYNCWNTKTENMFELSTKNWMFLPVEILNTDKVIKVVEQWLMSKKVVDKLSLERTKQVEMAKNNILNEISESVGFCTEGRGTTDKLVEYYLKNKKRLLSLYDEISLEYSFYQAFWRCCY